MNAAWQVFFSQQGPPYPLSLTVEQSLNVLKLFLACCLASRLEKQFLKHSCQLSLKVVEDIRTVQNLLGWLV
jgi:hypothetical protein